MNKSIINFLNRHITDLHEGRKVTGYGIVFWMNRSTDEIYAHSEDAEIVGVINGYKIADIKNGAVIAKEG